MKIYLATDHAGLSLKEKIKSFLNDKGYDVEDCGAIEYDPNDDYPDFIKIAAEKVSQNPNDRAIILGGTGQGEAIVANKFKNVRAVVFYAPALPNNSVDINNRESSDPFEIIRLSREHNNANVLSLSTRMLKEEDAINAVQKWLETPFSNEERHKRRINKISEIEKNE